jgi:hypothetical protein
MRRLSSDMHGDADLATPIDDTEAGDGKGDNGRGMRPSSNAGGGMSGKASGSIHQQGRASFLILPAANASGFSHPSFRYGIAQKSGRSSNAGPSLPSDIKGVAR